MAVSEHPDNESRPPSLESQVTSFYVSQFRFVGNTVFTQKELAAVVQGYTNRTMDFLELDQARVVITSKYINSGYVNSGAVINRLPDAAGVVTVHIVEGKLTKANVRGNRWLRKGFYSSRLGVGSDSPLNVNALRAQLQLWRQIYPLDQVNSELRPGDVPGEATLDLTVQERFPYHVGLQYANDRPPSTGSDRISVLLRAESLTGNADPFAFDYVIVAGGPGLQDPQFPGVNDLSVSYVFPFTAKDTALGVSYARSTAVVIEEPFRQLNITGESELFGLSLLQPIVRTPTRELTLSLSGGREENKNFMLGMPYSFSPGAINGESIATVVRLSAQFVGRSEHQMLAARLTFNAGVDALGATWNSKGPSGQFYSLLGQAQYLRRLGNSRNEFLIKVVGQYTPDPLMTLEQLVIGGAYSVRGYDENLLLRDYGGYGTAEFHIPLWSDAQGRAYIQVVPFASAGGGWNNRRETPWPIAISSAGLGVVFTPCSHLDASVFWGYPFQDIHYTMSNPQNIGFNFKVTIWAF